METAHIIGWNVVSAKLLSSHQSGHYRCRLVHGWCPPPVQLQSGGTFLAWTKLLQEMNLTKLLGGLLLHSASGLLLLPLSAPLSDLVSENTELCWARLSRLVKKKTVEW